MKAIIIVFLLGLGVSAYAQKQPQDSVRATVFTVVEVMPSFSGGKAVKTWWVQPIKLAYGKGV